MIESTQARNMYFNDSLITDLIIEFIFIIFKHILLLLQMNSHLSLFSLQRLLVGQFMYISNKEILNRPLAKLSINLHNVDRIEIGLHSELNYRFLCRRGLFA